MLASATGASDDSNCSSRSTKTPHISGVHSYLCPARDLPHSQPKHDMLSSAAQRKLTPMAIPTLLSRPQPPIIRFPDRHFPGFPRGHALCPSVQVAWGHLGWIDNQTPVAMGGGDLRCGTWDAAAPPS